MRHEHVKAMSAAPIMAFALYNGIQLELFELNESVIKA